MLKPWQRDECRAMKKLVDCALYGWEDCAVRLSIEKSDYAEARSIMLGIDDEHQRESESGRNGNAGTSAEHR